MCLFQKSSLNYFFYYIYITIKKFKKIEFSSYARTIDFDMIKLNINRL